MQESIFIHLFVTIDPCRRTFLRILRIAGVLIYQIYPCFVQYKQKNENQPSIARMVKLPSGFGGE